MVIDFFVRQIEGEKIPQVCDFRIIQKDGNVRWVVLNSVMINWKGRPSTLNFLSDITERKQVEEKLRESEELFKSYLEYAPDGVYLSDLEGNFLYGNRKCEEIIGYCREELVGKNFLELNILPEKSLNKAAQLLQANIEGKPTGPDEIELISKEGRLIPVEINTSVVQRMGQRIALAFVRDITERKRAEEERRLSEERFRRIFDEGPFGMVLESPDHTIIAVNKMLCELLGYAEQELIGQNIVNLTYEEDREKSKELLRTIIRKPYPRVSLGKAVCRKDGAISWANVTSVCHPWARR